MKKTLLVCAGFVIASCISAQQVIHNADGSTYRQCSKFYITKSLSQIAKDHPVGVTDGSVKQEAADKNAPISLLKKQYNPDATPEGYDPVRQANDGDRAASSPIENFDGQQSLLGYIPLDPNGMVSPLYYVQTVNSNIAVYNKNGTVKLPMTDLKNLFGSWTCDDGDPVVMYDKFADRWVITEFQENGYCGNWGNLMDTMMFAVSTTNDPTGTYYMYHFCPDNSDFADYPKYSIWADGYYETCNCQNDKVVVYDRTKMLTGDPTAGYIVMPFNNNPWNVGGQGGFFCPMTLYADGTLPPYGSPNYLFYFTDDNWGPQFKDAIVIDQIKVNWLTKSGAVSVYDTIPTAPFNSYFSGGSRQDIDQPGNPQSFDALDGFFSYRIPYMRWTNHNTAVMCNVVNVGTSKVTGSNIAGIRWYELRQDTTTKVWSIYQQGTYAPNDGVSRWNPAICMNSNGDIGLSYSVSDPSSVYPGLRYTGRTPCDTLGVMSMAEGTAISGSAVGNTYNRWGDYSHISVDPSDGITFWSTNMYVGGGGSINTRIFSFQAPTCVPTSVASPQASETELKAYQSGSMLNVIATKLPSQESVFVDLFDIQGKHIMGKANIPPSATIQTSFNVSSLASGIYFVRIGNDNFQKVIKVKIN